MMHRIEYDVMTGDITKVDQIAYKNENGDVLVLDAIDPTPEWYKSFDPYEEKPKK